VVNIFETIADRRIEEARKAGLFDNLPGKGKPIPDLGTERAPGWWAARLAKRERSIMKAEELDRRVRMAKPVLWRLDDESEVRQMVAQLNREIDDYNTVTTWERRHRFDPDEIVDQWKDLRS
jgi:hypothetical protein